MTDQAPPSRQSIALTLYYLRFPHRNWSMASCDEHELTLKQADAILALLTRPPSERPVAQVREALEREEKYLHALIDDEDVGSVMHGDIEGAFHRLQTALTAERPEAQMREALAEMLANRDGNSLVDSNGARIDIAEHDKEKYRKFADRILALTAERPEAAVAWRMTKEQLEHLVYEEVEADVETEADATNAFQEGYSVGFNDCRFRVVKRLLERTFQHEEPGREMHVEYVASRGQSKVTYWVTREEGDRIRRAALSPAQRDIGR